MCLLLSVGIGAAITIASTPAYYHWQFEATGIYASLDENGEEIPQYIPYIGGDEKKFASFTNAQLDELVDHIVKYLFTDKESFALEMDDVVINGVMQDDVNIFSETAVSHMVDVKVLLKNLSIVGIVCGIFAALFLLYFIVGAIQGKGGKLLKTTLLFYGSFFAILLIICVGTLIETLNLGVGLEYFTYVLWINFHFLIFPDSTQAMGSFFNDTLTMILSLDLFMMAVVIVLSVIVGTLLIWGVLARGLDARVKRMQ